jgi:hypothetical protein
MQHGRAGSSIAQGNRIAAGCRQFEGEGTIAFFVFKKNGRMLRIVKSPGGFPGKASGANLTFASRRPPPRVQTSNS